MISVTRRFEISYSHYLPEYNGKCANEHGHNAIIEVEFSSPEDYLDNHSEKTRCEYPMMLIDFNTIKSIVEPILGQLDHRNLNEVMRHPTAENICLFIVSRIGITPYSSMLNRVRVSETRDSWAEWRRK